MTRGLREVMVGGGCGEQGNEPDRLSWPARSEQSWRRRVKRAVLAGGLDCTALTPDSDPGGQWPCNHRSSSTSATWPVKHLPHLAGVLELGGGLAQEARAGQLPDAALQGHQL